jgi:hypothetical protein
LVNQAGTTMSDIVASVRRVTDIMSEISLASQEQITGIEQVNIAISEMDSATQQNAALVQDAAEVSTLLQGHAKQQSQLVSRFILDSNDGPKSAVYTAPAAAAHAAPAINPPPPARKPAAIAASRPVSQPAPRPAAPKAKPKNDDWEEF